MSHTILKSGCLISYSSLEETDERPFESTIVSISLPGHHSQFERGGCLIPSEINPAWCKNTYRITKKVYSSIGCKTFITAMRHYSVNELDIARLYYLPVPNICEETQPIIHSTFCATIHSMVVENGNATAYLYPANTDEVPKLQPLTHETRDWHISAFGRTWKPRSVQDILNLETLPYIDAVEVASPINQSQQPVEI